MNVKATIITAVVVVLAFAGLGYLYNYEHKARVLAEQRAEQAHEAMNEAQQRSKRVVDMLVARERKIASQARKSAQAQAAVSEALQRNKSWSDTDVPPDVQQALTGPFNGLEGRSPGAGSGLPEPVGGLLSDPATEATP